MTAIATIIVYGVIMTVDRHLTEAEKKGNVVNVSIDEDYLDENGKIDVDKMEIIAFDMINNTYRVLGENVGKAFKDGFDL